MDRYLDKFIEIQALGLETTHKTMTIKKWKNQTDDFVMGLNISFLNLVNNDSILTKKYKETILPLSDIAHNAGFNSDWIYKG
jgi:hypothetical protein